ASSTRGSRTSTGSADGCWARAGAAIIPAQMQAAMATTLQDLMASDSHRQRRQSLGHQDGQVVEEPAFADMSLHRGERRPPKLFGRRRFVSFEHRFKALLVERLAGDVFRLGDAVAVEKHHV